MTPLSAAVDNCNVGVVKMLLATGKVHVNVQTWWNRQSPLHLAVDRLMPEMVRALLISNQIDLNVTNDNGETPLWCAVERRDQVTVELLLQQEGLDVNVKDHYNGKTALESAEDFGDTSIVNPLAADPRTYLYPHLSDL
jgi:ankyrin repeat protein